MQCGLFAKRNGRRDRSHLVEPEIARIPDKKLAKYRRDKSVQPFDHYLDNIVRNKPHIRSGEVEEVLASASLLSRAPYEAYANMVYTDIKWPTITDENGEEATVVPALYYSFVSKKDRRVRRDAALALFGTWMVRFMVHFTTSLIANIPLYLR